MIDLVGLLSLGLVCIITYGVAIRWPDISKVLFIAILLRIILIFIDHFIVSLPDTSADAKSFEYMAWSIAQNGFVNLLDYYPGFRYDFFNWFLAIPYSLFGRSVLMIKSIGLMFGIGSIFLSWKIATIIWDKRTAQKVAWAVTLFPSLILYSVILMREVYICFFVLVAAYGLIKWIKTNRLKYFFLTLVGFTCASFFNGAMMVGAAIFLTIVFFNNLKKAIISILNNKINLKVTYTLSFIVISIVYIYLAEVNLPKLGVLKEFNSKLIFVKSIVSVRGEAAYPEWTKVRSIGELIYKTPIRATYFIFSPFPWDITKMSHLLGFFDSLLYMYLVFLIFSNREVIWKDPALRAILIILVCYVLVFGLGVGNFGTGIRHRAKITVLFILLASPLLKRLVLYKK